MDGMKSISLQIGQVVRTNIAWKALSKLIQRNKLAVSIGILAVAVITIYVFLMMNFIQLIHALV